MNKTLRLLSFVCLGLALAGCGDSNGYEGPQQYPLSGKVSYDGEPVDWGSITFIPKEQDQRPSGGVIENGAYSVPEAKGANAGKYRVEIHWSKKTGKQIKVPDSEEVADERKEALPAKYHDNSELEVEVGPGKTTFDFDLKP